MLAARANDNHFGAELVRDVDEFLPWSASTKEALHLHGGEPGPYLRRDLLQASAQGLARIALKRRPWQVLIRVSASDGRAELPRQLRGAQKGTTSRWAEVGARHNPSAAFHHAEPTVNDRSSPWKVR